MSKKTVLIIVFNNLSSDARVNRQIDCLSQDYQVISIAEGENVRDDHVFLRTAHTPKDIFGRLKSAWKVITRQFDSYYWSSSRVQKVLKLSQTVNVDLIIANDLNTLPVALKIAKEKNCPLIFDAHEYFPEVKASYWWWNLLFKPYIYAHCKKYMPLADQTLTVSPGLANAFKTNFSVSSTIITNSPPFIPLEVQTPSTQKIRMVHHGCASPQRHLEEMIETVSYLDERFSLDMYLVQESGQEQYLNTLKKLADKSKRTRILPPVKHNDIAKTFNQYDLGIYLHKPVTFNQKYALPNKFFDFIQARLAVVISDLPDMGKIIKQYQCGTILDDFSPQKWAKQLSSYTNEEIYKWKQGSAKAATQLCAQKEMSKLLNIVNELIY